MAFSVSLVISDQFDQEGLSKSDYDEMIGRLNRAPNLIELGIFAVIWSEYCCYRNFKSLLQTFLSSGTPTLTGTRQNAGVINLGKGQLLSFKIENHDSPSAIKTFQGSATDMSGIVSDIYIMGARPIGLLNTIRLGPLEEDRNINLLRNIVAGIAHYGNYIGVPTIGGETSFDINYNDNPLVNFMVMGLIETETIVSSSISGIGNPLIYVGRNTSYNRMECASTVSIPPREASSGDWPGDPFLEKEFIEGCLEALKSGEILAAQDIDGISLTYDCTKIALKGQIGIELDLDRMPTYNFSSNACECLRTESQDSMIFVVRTGKENPLVTRFRHMGLQALVVGRVLKEPIVRFLQSGKVTAEIPIYTLGDNTPITVHEAISMTPNIFEKHWTWTDVQLPSAFTTGIVSLKTENKLSWEAILLLLLDDPNIASKRWIWRQYDYQIQLNTVTTPGSSDASVIRLRSQMEKSVSFSNYRGIAATIDSSHRWINLDPERGSIAAVAEAARNLTCTGAEPLAIINEFYHTLPETTIGYWQLAMSFKGISHACSALGTPVAGSSISLYNKIRSANKELQPIQPTPIIGMVGLIHNLSHVTSLGWANEADAIWLLGVPLLDIDENEDRVSLNGSSYLASIHNIVTGRPPKIDLLLESRVQKLVRQAIMTGILNSAHDLSDGGLAVAVAESCITSGLGAHIYLPKRIVRLDRLLFSEGGSRVLVSLSKQYQKKWQKLLDIAHSSRQGIPARCIGYVKSIPRLIIEQDSISIMNVSIASLANTYEEGLPRRII